MLDVIQVGLGPLGRRMVQYAAQRPGLRVAGAVDPDPEIAGRDLADLCPGGPAGVRALASLDELPPAGSGTVAIVATVSDVARAADQIAALASRHIAVVSTCEELSYPWVAHPQAAGRIDDVCRTAGVACLGTGVNPGFLMDYFPAVLSGVCQRVDRMVVRRVQDATFRRVPFQVKIGAGLTLEEFAAKVARGALGHVGLPESTHLLARGLGWKLERVDEDLRPIVAERPVEGGYRPIEAGQASGLEQIACGFLDGREVIRLEFRASVGESDPVDEIRIEGDPSFTSLVPGGINGDVATCAVTLNAVPVVAEARPGLLSMVDIEPPVWGRASW